MTTRFVSQVKAVLFAILSSAMFTSVAEIIHIGCNDDFDKAVSRQKPYVIEIYSATCPACGKAEAPLKTLMGMPEYAGINLLKVEGSSSVFPYVAQRLQNETVSGYPTFIFFHANGTKFYKMTGFDVTNFQPRLDEMNAKHAPARKSVKPEQKPRHHEKGAHHREHHAGRSHHDAAYHDAQHKKIAAPAQPIAKPSRPAPQKSVKGAPAQDAQRGQLIYLNSVAQLEELKKAHSKLVLIFSTSWCGPCKHMRPTYEQMAAQYAHIPFVYVDGDSAVAGQLKGKYGVRSYPHVIFINNKGVKVGELPGSCDANVVHSSFSAHLSR